MDYKLLTKEKLQEELEAQKKIYQEYKAAGLKLNMARGKPCKEQLDLSMPMFDLISSATNLIASADMRNYGEAMGALELREYFAGYCGVQTQEIMLSDSSSLNIMYDTLQRAMQFGIAGAPPLNSQGKLKWLCPVPGYDRHFAITELFGFELIGIPMDENGPDMDLVEHLVQNDASVKGIWCVPKYSNPAGIVYSDETVRRFAALKPKAKDFRIFWDNAYMCHHLYNDDTPLLNLLNEAKARNNEDIVYTFGSTSKITFAGAGVSFIIASKKNIDYLAKLIGIQTIGPNKINHYLHYLFFQKEPIDTLMKKHSGILTPKFELVDRVLTQEVADCGIMSWSKPKGGYFISCDLMPGTAKRTVSLARECGVVFTPAGATYPYGKDPQDANIRIAPTLPPLEELETAMKVFAVSAKISALEKLI
jgi:DNA-binding transcriptional MocR family regulator